MDAHFSGNTPRRARQTEEESRQNPMWERSMWERSLALMHQGSGEVVEGALAGAAAVALAPGAVVVSAPGTDIVTLTPGTLERPIFPA
jgi:hypothetical protein